MPYCIKEALCVEEREVTLELKNYLSSRKWQILSIHFPGAQGGLSISANGKSRGWVPDLIAVKNNVVLTVESKPAYSSEDIEKLKKVFIDPRYLEKLRRKLSLSPEVVFQRAIAFHSLHFDESDVPPGFVVFTVKGKSEVSIFMDTDVNGSVKAVLQS